MAKVGRPTKYNKEMLEKAKLYVKDCKEFGDTVPNMAGLCIALGINKVTAYDWAKQKSKKEFSNTLDELQLKQECLLLSGGLSGGFNAAITKLMLCNHGYSDKQEIDNTSSDGSATPTLIILQGVRADDIRNG